MTHHSALTRSEKFAPNARQIVQLKDRAQFVRLETIRADRTR